MIAAVAIFKSARYDFNDTAGFENLGINNENNTFYRTIIQKYFDYIIGICKFYEIS